MCNNFIDFFSDPALLKDLVTGTVGAFLGFLGAYFIFVRGIKNEKKKDAIEQTNQQRDNLKYFGILFESVIKISLAQKQNFRDYSERIKAEPFRHHLLNTGGTQNLKRATQNLHVETYYLAYISQLGSNQTSIREFQKTIAYFDFTHAVNEDAIRVLQEKTERIFKKKLRFKELFEKSLTDAGQTMFIEHLRNDENLTHFINDRFNDYYGNRKPSEDFETPKSQFIDPLLDFLRENNYLHDSFLNQFFFQLRECIMTYNSILFDTEDLSQNFEEFSSQMEEANQNLEALFIRLKAELRDNNSG